MAITIRAKGVGAEHAVARVGDWHACPKVTSNIPHVGGPILKGSSLLKANGSAVARVGDMALCNPQPDHIKKGINSILVEGKPIAIEKSKTDHSGMVMQGSGSVFVAESLGPTVVSPESSKVNSSEEEIGPHWIQAKYDGAPEGMEYKIVHDDGTTVSGTLDLNGQTQRVEGLKPGTATIHFGDREKLSQELIQKRELLKQALDGYLKAVQQQAQTDDKALDAAPPEIKNFLYNTTMLYRFSKGVKNGIESLGEGIVHLFKDAAQSQQLEDQARQASIEGNDEKLSEVDQQITAQGATLTKPIINAYQTMRLLYKDPETRKILEDFAEQYYHSTTPLIISSEVGDMLGNLLPAIIIALIAKDPAILAANDSAGETYAGQATDHIDHLVATIHDHGKTLTVEEATVDEIHAVESPIVEFSPPLNIEIESDVLHHYTTHGIHIDNIVKHGINPEKLSPDSRFGSAFHVADDPTTAALEAKHAHSKFNRFYGKQFKINNGSVRILDLTDPEIAEEYGYIDGDITEETKAIGEKAKSEGYNTIKFKSQRGSGINYAVIDEHNELLTPMDTK